MPKFRVYASKRILYEATIEAEDLDDAKDLARYMAECNDTKFFPTDAEHLIVSDVVEIE